MGTESKTIRSGSAMRAHANKSLRPKNLRNAISSCEAGNTNERSPYPSWPNRQWDPPVLGGIVCQKAKLYSSIP